MCVTLFLPRLTLNQFYKGYNEKDEKDKHRISIQMYIPISYLPEGMA